MPGYILSGTCGSTLRGHSVVSETSFGRYSVAAAESGAARAAFPSSDLRQFLPRDAARGMVS